MLDHCCEERGLKKEHHQKRDKQSFYNGYTIKPMQHYPGAFFKHQRRHVDNSDSSDTDHDRHFISESGDDLLYEC